jgi:hypothetical protein
VTVDITVTCSESLSSIAGTIDSLAIGVLSIKSLRSCPVLSYLIFGIDGDVFGSMGVTCNSLFSHRLRLLVFCAPPIIFDFEWLYLELAGILQSLCVDEAKPRKNLDKWELVLLTKRWKCSEMRRIRLIDDNCSRSDDIPHKYGCGSLMSNRIASIHQQQCSYHLNIKIVTRRHSMYAPRLKARMTGSSGGPKASLPPNGFALAWFIYFTLRLLAEPDFPIGRRRTWHHGQIDSLV